MSYFFSLCLLFGICFSNTLRAQPCTSLSIDSLGAYNSVCGEIVMTMVHDQRGGEFVYVANKDAGLRVLDVSNVTSPFEVAQIPVDSLSGLHVMNLSQDGDYLYLALGDHFGSQNAGLAVIDVADPANPVLLTHALVGGSQNGAGIVQVAGNYAYLGAMQAGLVVFDISNKNSIDSISTFKPDIHYPPILNPNPNLYNVRGLDIEGNIAYVCFDAGGLRIVNISDPYKPVETGRFVNEQLYKPFNLPRAYNNVVVNDSLAYIAVDYCGVEIISVADTANIDFLGWWNPYDCPSNNWFTSPVHANELYLEQECNKLFVSTGKSDMYVLDVSDPNFPDSCASYGGTQNNLGTWGISVYNQYIYLSYICTLGVPFSSNASSMRILEYNTCLSTGIEDKQKGDLKIYPNPSDGFIRFEGLEGTFLLDVYGTDGRVIISRNVYNSYATLDLNAGIYLLRMSGNDFVYFRTLIIY